MTDTPMNHRPGAHDARFEGDIKRGFQQTIILQHHSALTQCHNFRVSCRIVSANRSVPAFTNHLVVVDQHCADRNLTFFPGTMRQRQRMTHPVFVIQFAF